MGKNNWLIVKRHDTGEYYPAINYTDIHWDFEKQCFVNLNNGHAVDIVHDLGNVTDKQQELFWQGFRLGMKSKESDFKVLADEKANDDIPAAAYRFASFDLKDILLEAKEVLKETGDSIGYTTPDNKYHIFIYVDETDEKVFVVEPNRVEDGAHEPFTGDTYIAEFGDYADLMVGCMWAMECFENDKILTRGPAKEEKISLEDFLNQFDFSYEVVMPDEPGERKHREKLMLEFKLDGDMWNAPLLRLVDLKKGNLGSIESDRYSINRYLVEFLIERLDVYINDSIISEFEDALQRRNIDTSSMNLGEMVKKARELGVPEHGEVAYDFAEYILNPELIDISDVLNQTSHVHEESLEEKISGAKKELNLNSVTQKNMVSEKEGR